MEKYNNDFPDIEGFGFYDDLYDDIIPDGENQDDFDPFISEDERDPAAPFEVIDINELFMNF